MGSLNQDEWAELWAADRAIRRRVKRRYDNQRQAQITICVVCLACIALGSSLLLAAAGEPQSYWLWHDVFGVIR